jgi:hypothetical protein
MKFSPVNEGIRQMYRRSPVTSIIFTGKTLEIIPSAAIFFYLQGFKRNLVNFFDEAEENGKGKWMVF